MKPANLGESILQKVTFIHIHFIMWSNGMNYRQCEKYFLEKYEEVRDKPKVNHNVITYNIKRYIFELYLDTQELRLFHQRGLK